VIDKPWIFPFMEDPADSTSRDLGKPAPVRPVVAVRLADHHESNRVLALVDSGCERVLAAPALARAVGVDLSGVQEVTIGIGSKSRRVQFATVRVQLFPTLFGVDEEPLDEWDAYVGFLKDWEPAWPVVLGRDGFLSRFTVTIHGAVPALAIEPYEAFDERFGLQIAEAHYEQPRFRP
jgi:hypothetical protein